MFGTSVSPCAMRRDPKPKRQKRAKDGKRVMNRTSRQWIPPKGASVAHIRIHQAITAAFGRLDIT
jgi:hypothetical protein